MNETKKDGVEKAKRRCTRPLRPATPRCSCCCSSTAATCVCTTTGIEPSRPGSCSRRIQHCAARCSPSSRRPASRQSCKRTVPHLPQPCHHAAAAAAVLMAPHLVIRMRAVASVDHSTRSLVAPIESRRYSTRSTCMLLLLFILMSSCKTKHTKHGFSFFLS